MAQDQSLFPCLSLIVTVTGTAEVIVTVGGEDDKVVLRSVESFDPLTGQWKSLACLPFAVSKHGLVVSGEEEVAHDISFDYRQFNSKCRARN